MRNISTEITLLLLISNVISHAWMNKKYNVTDSDLMVIGTFTVESPSKSGPVYYAQQYNIHSTIPYINNIIFFIIIILSKMSYYDNI